MDIILTMLFVLIVNLAGVAVLTGILYTVYSVYKKKEGKTASINETYTESAKTFVA